MTKPLYANYAEYLADPFHDIFEDTMTEAEFAEYNKPDPEADARMAARTSQTAN